MSWNVNSIKMREARVLDLLTVHQPDVLCLQELKCEADKFPRTAIEALGYACAISGQKTYNGVALLSRHPITDVQVGFEAPSTTPPQARWLDASIQGVRVASAYVPNGQDIGTDKYAYKLNWLEKLRTYLEPRLNRSQWIIGGDFNVAPEDRDIHDPDLWSGKILCSDPERKSLQQLMALGLNDTFRTLHTEGGQFSWWDYRALGFPKNHGLRIDLLLASRSLAGHCTQATIERSYRKGPSPSDHAPVSAVFEL